MTAGPGRKERKRSLCLPLLGTRLGASDKDRQRKRQPSLKLSPAIRLCHCPRSLVWSQTSPNGQSNLDLQICTGEELYSEDQEHHGQLTVRMHSETEEGLLSSDSDSSSSEADKMRILQEFSINSTGWNRSITTVIL